MNYFVLHLETANRNHGSICFFEFVQTMDDQIIDEFASIIYQDDEFSPKKIEKHGITADKAMNGRPFSDIWYHIKNSFNKGVTFHYGLFDKFSINQALAQDDLDPIEGKFVDIRPLIKHTWSNLNGGYGLLNLANSFGLPYFKDYSPPPDLRTAYNSKTLHEIFITALNTQGVDIDFLAQSPFHFHAKERNKCSYSII